jgi:hypothetical protein
LARAEQVKLYRSFVKGLITEASYLTYPEDASVDELNTVLSRKGNRTRRVGVDYEDDYQIVTIASDSVDVFSEFVWRSANNDAEHNFVVVQVGYFVYFFNLTENPVSDSLEAFSIDLRTYAAPGASETMIRSSKCEFASGKGYLFCVNCHVEPLLIEYDSDTNSITTTPVVIMVRDFEGINDGLANDQEPPTLEKEHHYNLLNQGWTTPGQYTVPGGAAVDNTPIYYDPYTGNPRTYDTYDGGPIP